MCDIAEAHWPSGSSLVGRTSCAPDCCSTLLGERKVQMCDYILIGELWLMVWLDDWGLEWNVIVKAVKSH